MDSSVMVFFAPYEKLDQRKKIVKQLKKVAVLLDASELSERDVRQYIKDYLRSQQYGIQEEALNTLLIKTQYSLTTCMKELDKLMVAEIGTYSIRLETVEALVAKNLGTKHHLILGKLSSTKTASAPFKFITICYCKKKTQSK